MARVPFNPRTFPPDVLSAPDDDTVVLQYAGALSDPTDLLDFIVQRAAKGQTAVNTASKLFGIYMTRLRETHG
ncbi:MAG: hypothetical protein HY719_08570 [Planctomycetes bacterium]|nr:hypothetical protein [Planctomycetota bacterium]